MSKLITKLFGYPVRLRYWKTSLLAGFLVALTAGLLGPAWGALFIVLAFAVILICDARRVFPQHKIADADVKSLPEIREKSVEFVTAMYMPCPENVFFWRYFLYFSPVVITGFCAFALAAMYMFPSAVMWLVEGSAYHTWLYAFTDWIIRTEDLTPPGANYRELGAHVANEFGYGIFLTPLMLCFGFFMTSFAGLMNAAFYIQDLRGQSFGDESEDDLVNVAIDAVRNIIFLGLAFFFAFGGLCCITIWVFIWPAYVFGMGDIFGEHALIKEAVLFVGMLACFVLTQVPMTIALALLRRRVFGIWSFFTGRGRA